MPPTRVRHNAKLAASSQLSTPTPKHTTSSNKNKNKNKIIDNATREQELIMESLARKHEIRPKKTKLAYTCRQKEFEVSK